jgi:hypothetical protein
MESGTATRLTCELCHRIILDDGIHTKDDGIEALVLHATKEHRRRFPIRVSHAMIAESSNESRFWIEARRTEAAETDPTRT